MENRELSALAEAIAGRIFVELEASGRHVHVTAQQALVLFGHPLTPKRPLSQPGQYLSNERVTVIGPKGEFQNVAVLGRNGRKPRWRFPSPTPERWALTPPCGCPGTSTEAPAR